MTDYMLNLILFTIELLTAEFVFCTRLHKRSYFILRICLLAVVSVGSAALLGLMPGFVFDNGAVVSMLFVGLFILTVLLMLFCFDEPIINIFFCGLCAYTMQHLAYGVSNLVLTLIFQARSPILNMYMSTDTSVLSDENIISFLIYLLCFYLIYGLGFMAIGKALGKNREISIHNKQVPILIGAGLLLDIVLNMLFVYCVPDTVVIMVYIIFSIYSSAACMLFLAVLIGMVNNKKLEDEKNFIEYVAKKQAKMYSVSKENMELINMKAHDMKYQLREIGKVKTMPQEAIDEIERVILVNDSTVKTGYEVLDTLLTEKSLYCAKNGISFSCIADGEAISFMSDADIYGLFGNAVDNAIEAAMKVSGENRVIGIRLAVVGEFVSVNIYNSCVDDVVFKDGLPQTTKADAAFHGFGFKSMKHIVEKYGGDIAVSCKDGIFNVDILVPHKK